MPPIPPVKTGLQVKNATEDARLFQAKDVLVINKPIPLLQIIFGPFDEHAARVNPEMGVPGRRISDLEFVQNATRVRYQNGAIYERPDGSMAWVHGAIGARYDQLGAASSWLGLPLQDEEPMSEGGRASVFERGTIYWWPDVGAIDLNEVLVHYTGIMCFGETDTDGFFSDSDEPYVLVGLVSPTGSGNVRSRIYGDEEGLDGVDAGESWPDLIELYRGRPYGMVLNVVLLEHDEGDPDKYRAMVQKTVDAGMDKLVPVIADALAGVPYVGPALAAAATIGLPLLKPLMTDLFNDLLGTDDEVLGSPVITLTAKDMVVLSARTPNSETNGVGFKVGYKVETPLISNQGASYKAYFGLVTV